MLEFLKGFFTTQSAFERVTRSVVLAGSAAAAAGQLPIPPKYAWILALVGGAIAAGDKNPTTPTN